MPKYPPPRRTWNEPVPNQAEATFRINAEASGWKVLHRGWPDFFCKKDGRIVLVEVKPRATSPLKREQARVMSALAAFGIPCFKWSPKGGFVRWHSCRSPVHNAAAMK